MKLQLYNLAHIEEATIEDQDLVVIVGDNGTGKTFLLETLVFLKQFYHEEVDTIIKNYLKENLQDIQIDVNWEKVTEFIRDSKGTIKNEKDIATNSELIHINLSIRDEESLNSFFINQIKELYPKTIDLVKKNILKTDDSKFEYKLINLPRIKKTKMYNFQLRSVGRNPMVIGEISEDSESLTERFLLNDYYRSGENFEKSEIEIFKNIENLKIFKNNIEEKLISSILKIQLKPYFGKGNPLFLPSERNLLMDSALSKAALSLINSDKIKQRYSEKLFNSAYLSFRNIAENFTELIEDESLDLNPLFEGKLQYSDDGEIEAIRQIDGTIIRRELFSTKQNRFIPFLLIHNPLGQYHEVVIEEPEAHLSIKSMCDLLKYIQKLVKSKTSVYLTTHSDVFYTRINNAILTNKDINAKVYEFKRNNFTTYLEEKERTEFGFEIDLFSKELNKLYTETLEIQKKEE